MEIKNENYIVIQGFMINQLHLKGNELLVYAIIYGFSQEDNQVYSGSLQYLANWTNSTKQGVQKNLKALVDKGYIAKNEKFINGVKETLSYMENSHEYLDEVLAHKFEANRYGNDNWRYVPEEYYDIMAGYRGTVPKDEEKCSLPLKYAFTPV